MWFLAVFGRFSVILTASFPRCGIANYFEVTNSDGFELVVIVLVVSWISPAFANSRNTADFKCFDLRIFTQALKKNCRNFFAWAISDPCFSRVAINVIFDQFGGFQWLLGLSELLSMLSDDCLGISYVDCWRQLWLWLWLWYELSIADAMAISVRQVVLV